jgi:hypothetical protein
MRKITRRRLFGLAGGLILSLCLPGCHRDQVFDLPIYGPTAADNIALEGTLVFRNGCILLETGSRPAYMLVLWPRGFSAEDRGGDLSVVDSSGRVVGSVGERLRLSGTPIPTRALEGEPTSNLPSKCGTKAILAVASVN